MSRWPALLVAVVGGAALAFAFILGATAIVAGILWLYVFGDDPWPESANMAFNIAIPLLGLAAWALFGWFVYRSLRRSA